MTVEPRAFIHSPISPVSSTTSPSRVAVLPAGRTVTYDAPSFFQASEPATEAGSVSYPMTAKSIQYVESKGTDLPDFSVTWGCGSI